MHPKKPAFAELALLCASVISLPAAAIDTAFETMLPTRKSNVVELRHSDQVVGQKDAKTGQGIPKNFPPLWLVSSAENGIVIAPANDESTIEENEKIIANPKPIKVKKRLARPVKKTIRRKPDPVKLACAPGEEVKTQSTAPIAQSASSASKSASTASSPSVETKKGK